MYLKMQHIIQIKFKTQNNNNNNKTNSLLEQHENKRGERFRLARFRVVTPANGIERPHSPHNPQRPLPTYDRMYFVCETVNIHTHTHTPYNAPKESSTNIVITATAVVSRIPLVPACLTVHLKNFTWKSNFQHKNAKHKKSLDIIIDLFSLDKKKKKLFYCYHVYKYTPHNYQPTKYTIATGAILWSCIIIIIYPARDKRSVRTPTYICRTPNGKKDAKKPRPTSHLLVANQVINPRPPYVSYQN